MNGKTVKETSVTVSQILMPEDANPAGNIHGGVIMKLIDNAAAVVALRHTRSNVVTASIDRLDFHNPAFVGELITLKASLNMTGKSSMEIGVKAEAENLFTGDVKHIASAYLTFVSLDADLKPREVPPLILETNEEKRRNNEAIGRKRIRLTEKEKRKN